MGAPSWYTLCSSSISAVGIIFLVQSKDSVFLGEISSLRPNPALSSPYPQAPAPPATLESHFASSHQTLQILCPGKPLHALRGAVQVSRPQSGLPCTSPWREPCSSHAALCKMARQTPQDQAVTAPSPLGAPPLGPHPRCISRHPAGSCACLARDGSSARRGRGSVAAGLREVSAGLRLPSRRRVSAGCVRRGCWLARRPQESTSRGLAAARQTLVPTHAS